MEYVDDAVNVALMPVLVWIYNPLKALGTVPYGASARLDTEGCVVELFGTLALKVTD